MLTVDENAIQGSYKRNQILTYSISIENTSAAAMTNVTAVDDLGTYTIPGPVSVTPLTYIGPAALYVNGVFSANITATTGVHNVTFAVGTIAVVDTVTIVYTVQVNEYALLAVGSKIKNTATVDADGLVAPLTAAFTLTLPTGGAYTITVAAATYTQNPLTGIVTVTPGLTTITVAGTI